VIRVLTFRAVGLRRTLLAVIRTLLTNTVIVCEEGITTGGCTGLSKQNVCSVFAGFALISGLAVVAGCGTKDAALINLVRLRWTWESHTFVDVVSLTIWTLTVCRRS
jgi:hypothetical protein